VQVGEHQPAAAPLPLSGEAPFASKPTAAGLAAPGLPVAAPVLPTVERAGGRPRVLLLTPDYPPARGGIQTLLARLVEHARGLDFTVLTLAQRDAGAYDRAQRVEVRRVGAPGPRVASIATLGACGVGQAWVRRPDLVVSGHIVTAPAAAAIRRLLGVPFIQYLYAMEVAARPSLTRFATRRARATVALGGYSRALALDAGAPAERIHVIAPGVDLPPPGADLGADLLHLGSDLGVDLPPPGADLLHLGSDLGVDLPPPGADLLHLGSDLGVDLPPPGADLLQPVTREPAARPTILTVARLRERYKGHDVLIRALPLIRARVPDVEWVVIGDGPLRPALEELARSVGVERHVRFLGSVGDRERDAWLARAHVFALPSRLPGEGLAGEGFGIVFLEAAASGLPVVAGGVGGALDAVRDGETGALVDPTDHHAVADAITELLLDPTRASAWGRRGAQWAQRFAWPLVARRFEELALASLA
jgi:phosphatidyl-myo-inositol dimannoside synthase